MKPGCLKQQQPKKFQRLIKKRKRELREKKKYLSSFHFEYLA